MLPAILVGSGCSILQRNRSAGNERLESSSAPSTSSSLFVLTSVNNARTIQSAVPVAVLSDEAQAEYIRLETACRRTPGTDPCPSKLEDIGASPDSRGKLPSMDISRRFVVSLEHDPVRSDRTRSRKEYKHADRVQRLVAIVEPLWNACDDQKWKNSYAGACALAEQLDLVGKSENQFRFLRYDRVETLFESVTIGTRKLAQGISGTIEAGLGAQPSAGDEPTLSKGATAKAGSTATIGLEESATISQRYVALNVSMAGNGTSMMIRADGAPGRGVDGSILVQAEAHLPRGLFETVYLMSSVTRGGKAVWTIREVAVPVVDWIPFVVRHDVIVRRVNSGSWTFTESDDFVTYSAERGVSVPACAATSDFPTWHVSSCDYTTAATCSNSVVYLRGSRAGFTAPVHFRDPDEARRYLDDFKSGVAPFNVDSVEISWTDEKLLYLSTADVWPRRELEKNEAFSKVCFPGAGSGVTVKSSAPMIPIGVPN